MLYLHAVDQSNSYKPAKRDRVTLDAAKLKDAQVLRIPEYRAKVGYDMHIKVGFESLLTRRVYTPALQHLRVASQTFTAAWNCRRRKSCIKCVPADSQLHE